jgi:hypothetical protein
MNKELIQRFLNQSCYDEQDQRELEDWINLEKFAELIVRECATICKDVGNAVWAEPHQSNMGTAQTCKAAIEKHFGVGE